MRIPSFVAVWCCSAVAWAQPAGDESFVRIVKLEMRTEGERVSYAGEVENRLDVPVAGLTALVRFTRQADVPVLKFIELDARPSSGGSASFEVVPSEVAPELDPASLVGVSVTIASYAVAPEIDSLRRMVRDGTDLDLLAAARSVGLDLRTEGAPVPDRLLFAVRDAAGEAEAEAGPEVALWSALLGRLLVKAGFEEDLARIASLLADPVRAVPADLVERTQARVERGGVLGLLGPPGTLAAALGAELRRRPGSDVLRGWLSRVAGRPSEEQPALLAVAAAAWPRVPEALAQAGDLATLAPLLDRLVADDWVTGLWLSLDASGDALASSRLPSFAPVLLLPWTIVQDGASGVRATVHLGAAAKDVPPKVVELLTRAPDPMRQALDDRLRLAQKDVWLELWGAQSWIARHGTHAPAAFARAIASALIDDPTMHSLAWPLTASFVRLVDPAQPGFDEALSIVAAALSTAVEPWSALQALADLEPLADSAERRGLLAAAYDTWAAARDEAVAKAAASRRASLGEVKRPVAHEDARSGGGGWAMFVIGVLAMGAYGWWRRR